ncbi:MAG: alpha-hydroxy-acid oxidizing protein [Ignavibacteriae bacterium]|nr:alpha-hydroxy-acid oxidizing protein [Ignavibacteriota bacterium]
MSQQATYLINIDDYESAAQAKLPKMVYDYYASGAHDEITLRENHAAYDRIKLQYRVLIDITQKTLKTEVLGHEVEMPVLIAPTAFQRMANELGEVATARAAGKTGTIMVLSTLSNSSIEEVVQAASFPIWFQLYMYKDRGATAGLVKRAEAAGCKAIVLTVDAPMWGRRERDVRNRFQPPKDLTVKNLMPAGLEQFPQDVADSGLAAYIASVIDPSVTWKDVEWLGANTKLPLLIKGIVRGDDAKRAVDSGVAGVIVSNHGGRQLDTSPATIEVLPEIVDAVAGRVEVLIDGGIRRGTDVVKAIALGARAVLVGRPILWGLAVEGQHGVERILNILRTEFDLAMGLCGCTSVEEIQRDLIFSPPAISRSHPLPE